MIDGATHAEGLARRMIEEAQRIRSVDAPRGRTGPPPLTRDLTLADDQMIEQVAGRLRILRTALTLRDIGRATATNHETARRYLSGCEPSLRFVLSVAREFGLSAEWLLFGAGPPLLRSVPAETLREAQPSDLLRALGERLDAQTRETGPPRARPTRPSG